MLAKQCSKHSSNLLLCGKEFHCSWQSKFSSWKFGFNFSLQKLYGPSIVDSKSLFWPRLKSSHPNLILALACWNTLRNICQRAVEVRFFPLAEKDIKSQWNQHNKNRKCFVTSINVQVVGTGWTIKRRGAEAPSSSDKSKPLATPARWPENLRNIWAISVSTVGRGLSLTPKCDTPMKMQLNQLKTQLEVCNSSSFLLFFQLIFSLEKFLTLISLLLPWSLSMPRGGSSSFLFFSAHVFFGKVSLEKFLTLTLCYCPVLSWGITSPISCFFTVHFILVKFLTQLLAQVSLRPSRHHNSSNLFLVSSIFFGKASCSHDFVITLISLGVAICGSSSFLFFSAHVFFGKVSYSDALLLPSSILRHDFYNFLFFFSSIFFGKVSCSDVFVTALFSLRASRCHSSSFLYFVLCHLLCESFFLWSISCYLSEPQGIARLVSCFFPCGCKLEGPSTFCVVLETEVSCLHQVAASACVFDSFWEDAAYMQHPLMQRKRAKSSSNFFFFWRLALRHSAELVSSTQLLTLSGIKNKNIWFFGQDDI